MCVSTRVEVPPPDMNASAWAKTLKPQAPQRAPCSVCGKSAASPGDTQRLWTAELRPLCLGRWPSAFGLSRSGTRVFVGLPAPRLDEMSLAAGKAGDRHILTGVARYVFLLEEPLNHQASCGATINKRFRHVEVCNFHPYVTLIQLKGESAGRRRLADEGKARPRYSPSNVRTFPIKDCRGRRKRRERCAARL